MSRRARRLVAWVLMILAGAVSTGVLVAIDAAPSTAATVVEPGVPEPDRALLAPLVVAGIGGLTWADVSPERTPALWDLLATGAPAGAVTVFTNGQPACPDGGWLSLSAGRAAVGSSLASWCLALPDVAKQGAGASITGWSDLATDQLATTYRPRIGTLGDALAEAHVCATAIGPGAALALASSDGTVARYADRVSPDLLDCPLTVVDLGRTSVLDGYTDQRLAADEALAELLAAVPAGTDVLVTSVSAPTGARLRMGVAVVASDRSDGSALLTSPSTRWSGVVRLLDVPPTITAALGIAEPAEFNGAPLSSVATTLTSTEQIDRLGRVTEIDRSLRVASSMFVPVLALLGVVVVAATWWLGGRVRGRRARAAGRTAALLALLALACVPVAAYLVAAAPWWRASHQVATLWLGIAAIALVLGLVVLGLDRGRARNRVWWPALAVSAVTVGVLLVDAVLGTPLHRLSPLGPSVVTGGRYYGLGNNSGAILAAYTVVLIGALTAPLVARRQRPAAVLTVLAVGAVALVIDVWPAWGADLGGGLALLPVIAYLAIVVSGTRVTWSKLALSGGLSLVVVAVIALLDWSRPPEARSHAGRFVQALIDGDAWETVARKAGFALATVGRGLAPILTLLVVAAVVLMLRQPHRWAPPSFRTALARWPTMHLTCVGVLAVLALGALLNDYGVRVLTIGLVSVGPAIAAVCVRASALDPPPMAPVSTHEE